MSASTPLEAFASTSPGLEPVCAAELRTLGTIGSETPGGVAFRAAPVDVMRACLHLRAASHVLVRVASFRARAFWEMEKRVRAIAWSDWLGDGPLDVRVTSKRSRLYHEGAIEERLRRWLGRPAGSGAGTRQLLVVRIRRDECTLSLDASGGNLHRRGYRLAVARAPLRETLAAGLLLALGWTGDVPLLDPFCGSGTLPIEAALLARRIAPGLASADRVPPRHAFEAWHGFEVDAWRGLVEQARAAIRPHADVAIAGADRDAGAVEAAVANAQRAGVEGDVAIHHRPLSAVEPARGPGLFLTNPPYGQRVRGGEDLRDLYAALGSLARARLPEWQVAFLSTERRLEGQTGLDLEEVLRTRNGGIPVRLVATNR